MTSPDAASLARARVAASAAAGRLRLPFRSRIWSGQAGEFSGGGTGSSLDFQDHRAYAPGDDPRHINWQAYARTGNYTMKMFREEVRPLVDLVLDVSDSMFFGERKALRVVELLHFLAEGSAAAGASVTIHAVKGEALLRMDPAELPGQQWVAGVRGMAAQDAAARPAVERVPLRANSIRVLLSDLLFPGDPDPMLRALGQRHGSLAVFCPWSAEEAAPSWSGECELRDVERGSVHPYRIEAATLRRYRDAYFRHMADWRDAARRHQAGFARVGDEDELATALYREAVPSGALEAV
jgi:uncharacterized protein (DUF58 family)